MSSHPHSEEHLMGTQEEKLCVLAGREDADLEEIRLHAPGPTAGVWSL